MPAGNDFCNNEILNVRVHNTDTDEGRGVPEIGKVVFDTRIDTLSLCTDTSPNADENGGGTWAAQGFFASGYTPTVYHGNTKINSIVTVDSKYNAGPFVVVRFWLKFNSTSTDSLHLRMSIPPFGDWGSLNGNINNVSLGNAWFYDSSAGTSEVFEVRPWGVGSDTYRYVEFVGATGGLGLSFTFASNDELRGTYILPAGDSNGNPTSP